MMETVLSDVSMPYATEADYQLALSEAWQGEVTVEEVADTTDEIRARRDRLLAATDWAVLPDSPLDAQSLEAVKTYRQALRDVPQQERFPSAITWPQMPELANQPDLCGFLGRQPPGGYQLIQTAIVPKAGIVALAISYTVTTPPPA